MFAANIDLPKHVRSVLPLPAQTRWRLAANAVLAAGGSDSMAIRKGWNAVTHEWQFSKREHAFVRKQYYDGNRNYGSSSKSVATPKPLYVCRTLENAGNLISWAKQQGFKKTLQPADMHTTVTYSKVPVDWMKMDGYDSHAPVIVPPGGPRVVERLGDGGAVALLFNSDRITQRHHEMRSKGASWDYPGYQPHVTISWDAAGVDTNKVEPYTGELLFGPEQFKPIDAEFKDKIVEKLEFALDAVVPLDRERAVLEVEVAKVDPSLGLVFGYAIVCKRDGEDYYDLNIDRSTGERVPEHIPEQAMLEAAVDFAESSRLAKEMHWDSAQGSVPFVFPLTSDIAKSMGMNPSTTGLMIGMKPKPELLAKFVDGTYKGFSIGGSRVKVEDVT